MNQIYNDLTLLMTTLRVDVLTISNARSKGLYNLSVRQLGAVREVAERNGHHFLSDEISDIIQTRQGEIDG